MERIEAIEWLNRRKDFANTGKVLHFDEVDFTFIRNYIHHYKKKLVSFESIVGSLNIQQSNMIHVIDNMINKLLEDFNIQTEIKSKQIRDPRFNMMMGEHPFETSTVDFVEIYK